MAYGDFQIFGCVEDEHLRVASDKYSLGQFTVRLIIQSPLHGIASQPAYSNGPPMARQLNAIQMAFRW